MLQQSTEASVSRTNVSCHGNAGSNSGFQTFQQKRKNALKLRSNYIFFPRGDVETLTSSLHGVSELLDISLGVKTSRLRHCTASSNLVTKQSANVRFLFFFFHIWMFELSCTE